MSASRCEGGHRQLLTGQLLGRPGPRLRPAVWPAHRGRRSRPRIQPAVQQSLQRVLVGDGGAASRNPSSRCMSDSRASSPLFTLHAAPTQPMAGTPTKLSRRLMPQPVDRQRRRPSAGQPTAWSMALAGWARSGGRAEAGPGGGSEQLDVAVRQHPVIAERTAEQMGGHDRHALGVQAAALTWAPWTHTSPSALWWTLPVHCLPSITNTPLGPITRWSRLAGELGRARSWKTTTRCG